VFHKLCLGGVAHEGLPARGALHTHHTLSDRDDLGMMSHIALYGAASLNLRMYVDTQWNAKLRSSP